MEFRWINRPAAVDQAVKIVLSGSDPEAALKVILRNPNFCKGMDIPQNKRIRFLSQVRKDVEQKKPKVCSPEIPPPKNQDSHETIIYHMQHW